MGQGLHHWCPHSSVCVTLLHTTLPLCLPPPCPRLWSLPPHGRRLQGFPPQPSLGRDASFELGLFDWGHRSVSAQQQHSTHTVQWLLQTTLQQRQMVRNPVKTHMSWCGASLDTQWHPILTYICPFAKVDYFYISLLVARYTTTTWKTLNRSTILKGDMLRNSSNGVRGLTSQASPFQNATLHNVTLCGIHFSHLTTHYATTLTTCKQLQTTHTSVMLHWKSDTCNRRYSPLFSTLQ